MAEQKIFAGPRIRRIRKAKGLTQTAMAEGLGISPSYLNLIERNQRPLTVQLILKLSAVYKVDAEEFQAGTGQSIAALREVFADPLLAGELPGDEEKWSNCQRARRTRPPPWSSYTAPIASRPSACRTSPRCWRGRARPRSFRPQGCRSTRCARHSSDSRTTLPRSRERPRPSSNCCSRATISPAR